MMNRIALTCTIVVALFSRLSGADQAQSAKLDRIIHEARVLRGRESLTPGTALDQQGKCGLWLSFQIIEHWQDFSESQRQEISSLLAIPARQKSRTIGHFTMFYDTTGTDAPALVVVAGNVCQHVANSAEQFVDSAGKFFNDVWDIETGALGYSPPPVRGDGTYWIDIHDLGFGLYGRTIPDPDPISTGPPPRYNTYIEIDNDFCDVFAPSRGIPGLQVTAAHEFHHAIQLGSYGYWGSDLYFYEITSTWMEDVVYTSVNDYFQYLSNSPSILSQFSYPFVRFTEYNGSIEYSRAVWGKFVEKRYSNVVMRHSWEYMRQVASIQAIDHALNDAGSSFRQAFLEWAFWNSNTGPASDTAAFYAEGRNYPSMRLRGVVQYTSPQKIIADSLQTLSSVYHPVLVGSGQMMVIISNVNPAGSGGENEFTYVIADNGDETFRHLANGVYVKLLAPDPEHWSTRESVPSIVNDVVVFPNPYISRGSGSLNFRLPPVTQPSATLAIFSGSLDQIISRDVSVIEVTPSEPFVTWDGHDELGNSTPSGVYFYVITVDGKQYTGKFAIIRE